MLTPQEVSERAFPKASFGGYNMGQVDEFLDQLTADYTALYNENAVLKNKMKVLVEKVEEYRSTEEAMRKALMAAQHLAEEMLKEAERKSAAVIRDAEEIAKAKTASIRKEIETEQLRLQAAQQATATFVSRMREIHEKELEYLDRIGELVPAVPAAPAAEPKMDTISEIDGNIQRLVAQAMGETTGKREEKPAEKLGDTAEFPVQDVAPTADVQKEASAARRIDFSKLKFGRDYEIK